MNRRILSAASIFTLIALFAGHAQAEALRDPTRPLSYSYVEAEREKLVLQGIFVRDSGRVAMLNGQMVREGEIVAGARVVTIGSDSVGVVRDGARQTLYVRASLTRNE